MTLISPVPLRSQSTVIAHPRKLIALGDSLIYGYGDPEGGGWVERLRRYWMFAENPNDPGVIVYNLGVRGDGVQQVAQRLKTEFSCRGELRNRLPDGILLGVGLNDSARVSRPNGRAMVDLDVFEQEMHRLLEQAKQFCPVWVVGMPPVNERKMPYAGCLYYSHRDQYRYKEATRQICRQLHVPYLDIFDHWLSQGDDWWQSRLCEDGIHPNVEGYRSLFDTVMMWKPLTEFALSTSY